MSLALRAARTATCASSQPPRADARAAAAAPPPSRRALLGAAAAAALAARAPRAARAEPPVVLDGAPLLCDAACGADLAAKARTKTASGLEYVDLAVGTGPAPPVGYQVVVDYVAMTPDGRVFDSSLARGAPYDVRVGAGQVVAGLDEGLRSMRVGGVRRLYVPGELAYPKGLPSAAGRPRVPPASPIMFDVALRYVPGLEADEE